MAKDKYFDLRQSTRAYQNPYEAGGIGVGGLTQSARYNRQQVGSSFLSAPTGVNTWSKSPGSRSMGRGGMADMPTDGPTPLGGPPDRPQRMGPAGPSATAAGVAGRFDRPSENTFEVTGTAGRLAGLAISGAGAALGSYLKNRPMSERKRLKEIQRLEALGPDRPMSQPFEETVTLGKKKVKPMLALPAAETPFDPQAQQVSVTESMGRSRFGPLREPTGGPIVAGPAPQPLALPAGPSGKPRASYAVSGTDESAARVSQVGGTYTDVGMRPSAEAEAVQQAARMQEYPAAKAESRNKNRGKKK